MEKALDPQVALSSLPPELHQQIVHSLHLSSKRTTPWDVIALSMVNGYWREICLPLVFRDISLTVNRSPKDLNQFISANSTKYGHFVRTLHIDYLENIPRLTMSSQAVAKFSKDSTHHLISVILSSLMNLSSLFVVLPLHGFDFENAKRFEDSLDVLSLRLSLRSVVVTGMGGHDHLASILRMAPAIEEACLERAKAGGSPSVTPAGLRLGVANHAVHLLRLGFHLPASTVEPVPEKLHLQPQDQPQLGGGPRSLLFYQADFAGIHTVLRSFGGALQSVIIFIISLQDPQYPRIALPSLTQLTFCLSSAISRDIFDFVLTFFRHTPVKHLGLWLRGLKVEQVEQLVDGKTFPLLEDIQLVLDVSSEHGGVDIAWSAGDLRQAEMMCGSRGIRFTMKTMR